MLNERTWEETSRDVDGCREILLRNDAQTIERRALRQSKIPVIQTFIGFPMPSWTGKLLSEAGDCYVDGHYTGCIASLAAGVEHGLGVLCPENANETFEKLIDSAFECGFLTEAEKQTLHELRDRRNAVIHNNITDLAAGVKLQIQQAVLNKSGISGGEWSDKYDPRDQGEHEMAASLSAERKSGELFLRVRGTMFEIFGRVLREPK